MDKADAIIAGVGARVAELRRANGWTQEDLADRLRMQPQSVQRIERGTNLTIRSLVRLARTLGVPMLALLDPPRTGRRRPGRPRKNAGP